MFKRFMVIAATALAISIPAASGSIASAAVPATVSAVASVQTLAAPPAVWKVMVDGDSLGQGNDGFANISGGIVPTLDAALTAAGVPHTIVNVSVGGTTYANRAANIRNYLAIHQPDLVIVIAGHNDAANGNGANVSASVAQSVRLYTDAVLQWRNDPNRIKLVFGTIPLTTDASRPWLNPAINTANYGMWKSWYDWAYAQWVPDLYDMTGLPPQFLGPDHVHPTLDGYEWMAWRVYEALAAGGQLGTLPPRP